MKLLLALMACLLIQQCDIYIASANQDLTPLEQVIHKSQPRAALEIIKRIAFVIEREAERYSLDPDFLAAMIWVESRFKYTALGKKGEIGLMQIRFEMWYESSIFQAHGVDSKRKLQWIGNNVRCGAHIISHFIEKADGDIVKALYRYNSGQTKLPQGVERHEISYANKVLVKMMDISAQTRR